MTLILELSPEKEAQFKAEAIASGIPVEAKAAEVLSEWLESRKAVRLAALDRIVGHTTRQEAGFPPLPDEAMDRESIYEGRE